MADTRPICRREGCLGGLDALDAFMFDDVGGAHAARAGGGRVTSGTVPPRRAGTAGHRPSPLDRNLLEYSYVEGERFVAALAAREDGAALDATRLLAAPPHDPLQILDPDSFPDTARERRNRRLLDVAAGTSITRGPPAPTRAFRWRPRRSRGSNSADDPARRAAAVDGFTRLVTAMVAVQFHDPDERAALADRGDADADRPSRHRPAVRRHAARARPPARRDGSARRAGGRRRERSAGRRRPERRRDGHRRDRPACPAAAHGALDARGRRLAHRRRERRPRRRAGERANAVRRRRSTTTCSACSTRCSPTSPPEARRTALSTSCRSTRSAS